MYSIEKDINKILKIIEYRFNTKLPQKGILAGQALASAVYEYYKLPINPIYNDIDIFDINRDTLLRDRENKKFFVNSKINYSDFSIELKESYSGAVEFNKIINDNYVLDFTMNIGDYNLIYIKDKLNFDSLSVERIVNSFDFNAVRIGYDLEKNILYYNNDFIEFLMNRNLEIKSFRSPYHSYIRFYKKIEELGITDKNYSIEETSLKIATSIEILNNIVLHKMQDYDFKYSNEIHDRIDKEKRRYFPAFGNKYFNMYIQNCKNNLYFDLEAENKYPLYRLKNLFEGHKDIVHFDLLTPLIKKYNKIDNSKTQLFILLEEYKLLNLNKLFKKDLEENKKIYYKNPEFYLSEASSCPIMSSWSNEEKELYIYLKKIYNNYFNKEKIKEINYKYGDIILNIDNYIFDKNDVLLNEIFTHTKTKKELIDLIITEKINFNEVSNFTFYLEEGYGKNIIGIDKKRKKILKFKNSGVKNYQTTQKNNFINALVLIEGYKIEEKELKESKIYSEEIEVSEDILF